MILLDFADWREEDFPGSDRCDGNFKVLAVTASDLTWELILGEEEKWDFCEYTLYLIEV